jgi:hypothetical protein
MPTTTSFPSLVKRSQISGTVRGRGRMPFCWKAMVSPWDGGRNRLVFLMCAQDWNCLTVSSLLLRHFASMLPGVSCLLEWLFRACFVFVSTVKRGALEDDGRIGKSVQHIDDSLKKCDEVDEDVTAEG